MNALDTNVWIYSHDRRDPNKQLQAQNLIASVKPMALLWQVGCEFVAASRKLQGQGFTEDLAWTALLAMKAMADIVVLPEPDLWDEARQLQASTSLSFWDALLIAACIRGGVQTLFSEDFGSPTTIGGLAIVNPFVGP